MPIAIGRQGGDRNLRSQSERERHQRLAWLRRASLHDVTHLGCRAARYRPVAAAGSCSPTNVQRTGFPVTPGAAMPVVKGCRQQDYSVLIVIGVGVPG